ncbi:MAG: hypothetical protein KKH98_00465 [Spirochaetes bacterium]|nr:hypothetical protein [Spirochaetota bacterium]
MIKRDSFWKAWFIIFTLFFSLSSVTAKKKTQLIKSDKTVIEVPEDWKVTYKNNKLFLYSIYSTDYAVMTDLVKEELKKKMTFDEFFNYSVKNIKKSLPSYKLIEKKDNYQIFSTKTMGVEVINLQAYFLREKTAYILALSASKKDFKSNKEQMLKVVRSFKFTDKKGEK